MDHSRTRLVRVPFLIPTWAAAQVLWPRTILVKQGVELTPAFIAHELVHVERMVRIGMLAYWWGYLRLRMRYSYRDHPWEVAAREGANNTERRAAAKRVIGRTT